MYIIANFQFRKGLILLIGFVFVFTSVCAQREYDLLGKGARAAGMAYAFNAVADDATAISWNPAGLAQIKKPEIAIVNSLVSTEYRHAIYENDYKPIYFFDYLGFVYPLKLKKKDLVFGIGYQNKMNYKSSFKNLPSIFTESHGKNNLTVNSVSICTAFSINRFFSAGTSYNHWFSLGNKDYTYELYYTKQLYESDSFPDETIYETTEHFSYTGNNYTVGIMVDFSSFNLPLRYGLKYEGGFVLKDEYDYTNVTDHHYYDKDDTTWIEMQKGIRKYEFPGILTNGLSFRPGDYLTLAFDIDLWLYHDNQESSNYSYNYSFSTNNQTKSIADTIIDIEGTFQYSKVILNQYRIGLEYIFHPKFGLIPARAGWKINPTTLNTYDKNFIAIKRILAHSVNAGAGLILKNIAIDMAYEPYWYNRMDEKNRSEKKLFHFFTVSAIWHFK